MIKKKNILSAILLLGLALSPINYVNASGNALVQMDIKKSAGDSVYVTLFTTGAAAENPVVTKKSDNKYVILMPNVSGNQSGKPDLAAINDIISDVDIKSVEDGAEGYTKVTLITKKPINIKTNIETSGEVPQEQAEYRQLIAKARANGIKTSRIPSNEVQVSEQKKAKYSLREHPIWALVIPFIIMGGIYGGIFTPTEAAAVVVIYGIIVAVLLYKQINLSAFKRIAIESVGTSCSVLLLVVLANAFSRVITILQVPALLGEAILGFSSDPIVILLLINFVLLIVGMFMDTTAAILVLTPIFLPITNAIGMDPVHFGVMMVTNLAIGFCTPPLGVDLFVASKISGLSVEEVVKGILPMLVVLIFCLGLITFIPALSLALL